MENITQTAKFTAKASVLAVSAKICSRLNRVLLVVAAVTNAPDMVDQLEIVTLIRSELPERG